MIEKSIIKHVEEQLNQVIETKNIQEIATLLQKLIDYNFFTKEMIRSLVELIAKKGYVEVMICAARFGAIREQIIYVDSEYGNQVIYKAVLYNQIPMIKYLIENFSEIKKIIADYDNKLLKRALGSGYIQVAEYLLSFDAVRKTEEEALLELKIKTKLKF